MLDFKKNSFTIDNKKKTINWNEIYGWLENSLTLQDNTHFSNFIHFYSLCNLNILSYNILKEKEGDKIIKIYFIKQRISIHALDIPASQSAALELYK